MAKRTPAASRLPWRAVRQAVRGRIERHKPTRGHMPLAWLVAQARFDMDEKGRVG